MQLFTRSSQSVSYSIALFSLVNIETFPSLSYQMTSADAGRTSDFSVKTAHSEEFTINSYGSMKGGEVPFDLIQETRSQTTDY